MAGGELGPMETRKDRVDHISSAIVRLLTVPWLIGFGSAMTARQATFEGHPLLYWGLRAVLILVFTDLVLALPRQGIKGWALLGCGVGALAILALSEWAYLTM